MNEELIKDLSPKMSQVVSILQRELSGLRAGRVSMNFLDPVIVEAYDSRMPLSQIATVSIPDFTTIVVQVWDRHMVKAVEKAIIEANLGINPCVDGQSVRISVPPLSEERRKELVKLAHKYGENSKVALRNVRRDSMTNLKKAKDASAISEDEYERLSEKVQNLIDKQVAQVDDAVEKKAAEIMKI